MGGAAAGGGVAWNGQRVQTEGQHQPAIGLKGKCRLLQREVCIILGSPRHFQLVLDARLPPQPLNLVVIEAPSAAPIALCGVDLVVAARQRSAGKEQEDDSEHTTRRTRSHPAHGPRNGLGGCSD